MFHPHENQAQMKRWYGWDSTNMIMITKISSKRRLLHSIDMQYSVTKCAVTEKLSGKQIFQHGVKN